MAKDGTELLIGQNVQLLIENGVITGLQSVARDLTDQRRAEDALRKMEEYRNLFRLANDSILILETAHGRVLDVNDKACNTYGISRDDFIGRSLSELTKDSASAGLRIERLRTDGALE